MALGFIHYFMLSAVLFSIGFYGVLSRRNAVAILMAIEIMFNAVNIAMVAISRHITPVGDPSTGSGQALTGQVFAVFIITVAAAEATVGLALIIAIFRRRETVNIEEINLMKW